MHTDNTTVCIFCFKHLGIKVTYIWTRRLANIGAFILCIFLLLHFTNNRVWNFNGFNNTNLIGDGAVFFNSTKKMHKGQSPYHISQNSYSSKAEHPGGLYCYPPTLATILAPLSTLSIMTQNILWYSIITICTILSLYLILRIALLIGIAPPQGWRFPVTAGISALLFEPIQNNFIYAQANTLLLLTITSFMFLYLKRNNFLAGFILGFGITLKFFPLIFIPYLVFRKEWKIIFIAGASSLIFLLLPLIYVDGIPLYTDFIYVFKARSKSNYNYVEFFTTFYRSIIWLLPELQSKIIKICSVLVTISIIIISDYLVKKRNCINIKKELTSSAFMLAVFSTTILLIHPHSEVHIMIYSYPAFLLTGMYALRTKQLTKIICWGGIYGLFVPLLWVQSTPITFISLILLNTYCIYIAYFQKNIIASEKGKSNNGNQKR